MMGHLKVTKPNIIKFHLPEHLTKKANDFPEEVYFVQSNIKHCPSYSQTSILKIYEELN